VKPGDRVKRGTVVAVIEALKMEINVSAAHSGVVVGIFVYEGQRVWAGDTLVVVE
jgi:biotin carboxyl carrier protein